MLTAASRHALKAVLDTLTETTQPVEGASCRFVRHRSMDAVDKKMRIDGRDELRRQRQHQARAKARAARAQRMRLLRVRCCKRSCLA